jgi:hypothetical protein
MVESQTDRQPSDTPKSLTTRQCEFCAALGRLLVFAAGRSLKLKIQGPYGFFRTESQQAALVAAKKSKTMNSRHLSGLAADLTVFVGETPIWDGKIYRQLGEFWETQGGRWGGRFGVDPLNYSSQIGWDPYHFEFKP